jgi:1,4-dihydroxy-2-naphthoate octaprenyltransferase
VGTTSVIFGKHIDKLQQVKERKIFTLPVVLGETAARWTMTGMLIMAYLLVLYLIWTRFFTPVLLLTLLAIPKLIEIWPILSNPKPAEKPEGYPDVWPNYYVAAAFVHTRRFGGLFLLAVIVDTIVQQIWPLFWN